ncbi:inositol monophosphatase family protein [Brevibacillus migulae]|uniref:inositol monophosphatase family protein n=1 Tax=Brevibacillus migulae TaxID=1644114 RepID=UPI00106E7677|nr:inositol monophosphatase family protein [Brevibacillus migulae]
MIDIAIQAAKEAGAYLKERFTQQLFPDLESHNDVKLPEDKESERRIIEVLHRHFPTHTIISEEVGLVKREDEYLWIVDPLDGTNNYFIGYPYFSVSIALQYKGEIVLGVVYNPVSEQLFWAEKGKGAFLNGKKLAVNTRKERKKAVGTYVRGRESISKEDEYEFTKPFFLETKRLMRNIGPALDFCLLAHGWIDYIVFHKSGIMDVAAGLLIAQEAGAVITYWDSSPYEQEPYDEAKLPSFLVTNGVIHEDIRRLLR